MKKLLIIIIAFVIVGYVSMASVAHAYAAPLVVAHRATWVGGYPENSAKAFVNTHLYAKVLETDVRETSDHLPIFSHDSFGTQTYAQMRAKGNASILDLRVFLNRSSTNYAIVEVKQSSYSTAFWTEFNKILLPYKSRIIIYSLVSNQQTRDLRLKYGYQGMYMPRAGGVSRPSRSQILYVGSYAWVSPRTYSSSERSGIRFMKGLADTNYDWDVAKKYYPWGIITNYAKTAVVSRW